MKTSRVPRARVGVSVLLEKINSPVCAWSGDLSPSGARSRMRNAAKLEELLSQGFTIVGAKLDKNPNEGGPVLIGLILEKRPPRPTHRRRAH